MVDVSVSMPDKFQQLPVEFVKVLRLRFIDKMLDSSSVRSSSFLSFCRGCLLPMVQPVRKTTEIPQQCLGHLQRDAEPDSCPCCRWQFCTILRGSCHEEQVLGDVRHALDFFECSCSPRKAYFVFLCPWLA